jgi:single-stranded DNA-specific DHH superfamily exonuclease
MLTAKQIKEIRVHLEKAQNPVFFFDNDADGLCSFLLLQRFIGRGKGVPVRSFPDMGKDYFRKVDELGADYIFILDKPIVSKDFFSEVDKHNIPTVWIDHHGVEGLVIPDNIHYYNPVLNKNKNNEPVTFLVWQIVNKERKNDSWLASIGCISDSFLPPFYDDVLKDYPELGVKAKNAFDVYYKTELGKIARIFNFALKDRTTNVILMLKYLMKVSGPYDVLNENSKNKTMHQRYDLLNKTYRKFVDKAIAGFDNSDKILFFQYGGDMSISSDISNELYYKFPSKIIVVVYVTGIKANISARGKNVKEKILNSIKDLDGATGGGHNDAVGAKVLVDDIEIFRDRLEKII